MEPEGVDSKTASQLLIAGKIMGAMYKRDATPAEIREMAKDLDVDVLQAYLHSKPKGFLYAKDVQLVIDLAKSKN